jgi:hypothetical protein
LSANTDSSLALILIPRSGLSLTRHAICTEALSQRMIAMVYRQRYVLLLGIGFLLLAFVSTAVFNGNTIPSSLNIAAGHEYGG